MKKAITLVVAAAIAVFMANCTPKAAKTVAATPEPKSEVVVGYSAAQIEAGHVLFTNNCAKCHKMKEPQTHNAEQWTKILNRMIPKAKLSEEDGRLVRAYVMANAKQG